MNKTIKFILTFFWTCALIIFLYIGNCCLLSCITDNEVIILLLPVFITILLMLPILIYLEEYNE